MCMIVQDCNFWAFPDCASYLIIFMLVAEPVLRLVYS